MPWLSVHHGHRDYLYVCQVLTTPSECEVLRPRQSRPSPTPKPQCWAWPRVGLWMKEWPVGRSSRGRDSSLLLLIILTSSLSPYLFQVVTWTLGFPESNRRGPNTATLIANPCFVAESSWTPVLASLLLSSQVPVLLLQGLLLRSGQQSSWIFPSDLTPGRYPTTHRGLNQICFVSGPRGFASHPCVTWLPLAHWDVSLVSHSRLHSGGSVGQLRPRPGKQR